MAFGSWLRRHRGRALLLAAGVAVLAGAVAPPAVAEGMLFINRQRIIAEMPEAQQLGAELRDAHRALQEQARGQLRLLDEDLLQCRDLATQQRNAEAQACAQKNQMDRAAAQSEYDTQAQELEQRRQQALLGMIQRIAVEADRIRGENGASAVFDLSAQGAPIMAYDETLDITARVLETLVPK